jgi:hypothetical protein
MDRQAYLFLLQQCIALDNFSDGHSDYWTFGLLNFRTIGPSDYRADTRQVGGLLRTLAFPPPIKRTITI